MYGLVAVLLWCSIYYSRFGGVIVVEGVEILSKSKLERCEKGSNSASDLNCTTKIVLNMAVPSGSSGGEASIVAEIVEVEENSTNNMQNLRVPPRVTVNKSAAYALYELTYIRDVAYKPQEYYVKTRKCEPDAGANVVKICERLRDADGHFIEHTEPICCPCGPHRRVPSSCGNFFDKLLKGKANTAHCVRFPGEWFHVFGIGRRSIGFSIRIEVKTGSKVSEVIVGPEYRTATSKDNFLRVNLIGDFVGYSSVPTFEDFYLVTPRQGEPGQLPEVGKNFSSWMLLERVRFTLDGLECNKIGVSYEAFNGQPNLCSSPLWSCLHNQLWNFQDADQNRINRKQLPLYGVEGRFERINQHPNAGTHSFSIGITEVLNTNLLIELRADDIEYVYQRSPGKILSIDIPTFEALTQFGVATITTKNTGDVEASYSLTFECSKGVGLMEEQFFIMKPNEIATRPFKLYPTTDQAARYLCAAILKDSNFNEVDRAECQFSTTATIIDNGSQACERATLNRFPEDSFESFFLVCNGRGISPGTGTYSSVPKYPVPPVVLTSTGAQGIWVKISPFQLPEKHGFWEFVKGIWNKLWEGVAEFITGKTCRQKCTGFFDFSCHIQYICLSWMIIFGLLLAIFPTVVVLLWLLHQKGLFDPIYDWWEDSFWTGKQSIHHRRRDNIDLNHHHVRVNKHHELEARHHRHDAQHKRRSVHQGHRHRHSENYYYLHHVNKDKKHKSSKKPIRQQVFWDGKENDGIRNHRNRKDRDHNRII